MSELTFTRPDMLWGLLATALPLIIHLINRHRARRHPFAAIDFLLRVKRRTARRILLRHILLLATRTLLLAALVVAAAGPVLQPRHLEKTEGPATTVLIVDRSLSMQAVSEGQSWLASALHRAAEFVRGMPPGDRACVLAAGSTSELLTDPCTDSRRTLLAALDDIEPGWGTSDLTGAMEMAALALSRAITPNRRIVLLTDASAHAFPGAPRWPPHRAPSEVVLEDVVRNPERDNHAVVGVEQRLRGHYLEVTARVSSFATTDQQNLTLGLKLGEEVLTRGFVDLPAGKTVHKVFNIPAPRGQENRASIHLATDLLPPDDSRVFFVSGQSTIKALLVDGDMRPVLHQDELFYLEHALSPSTDSSSGIFFSTITPERFHEGLLDGVDVVFLANIRELAPDAVASLHRFVSGGGGLFISLGNHVDTERLNAMFEEMLPWPLRDIVALGPADPDGVHRRGIAFASARLDHPVLALFTGEQARALRAVRTWRAAVVEPGQSGAGSRVLLQYTSGSPALVEGTYHAGRILLFTSTLDRDWTSWPTRASFLPFLQRATAYLSGRLGRLPPLEATVGDSVSIPVGEGADRLRVLLPDGRTKDLGPAELQAGRATFRDTQMPGWYKLESWSQAGRVRGGTVPGLIVHVPPRESSLIPLDADRLSDLVGQGLRLTIAGEGAAGSRPKSMTFLFLALALVLAEALLVRK